jgi:regulator of nonsense transcripts 2
MADATTREETSLKVSPTSIKEEDELVEQDIRDRFKKMCEGYFDNVCKKLVIEHKVSFR